MQTDSQYTSRSLWQKVSHRMILDLNIRRNFNSWKTGRFTIGCSLSGSFPPGFFAQINSTDNRSELEAKTLHMCNVPLWSRGIGEDFGTWSFSLNSLGKPRVGNKTVNVWLRTGGRYPSESLVGVGKMPSSLSFVLVRWILTLHHPKKSQFMTCF